MVGHRSYIHYMSHNLIESGDITVMDVYEKVESVGKLIGVAPSTVKKYYSLFEQEGYKFKRSNEGYVLFSNHDINLLKELIILKNRSGMTVQKAVKQLVKDEVISDITDISDMTNDVTVISKQITAVMSDMTDMKQLLKEQNELIMQQHEDSKQEKEVLKQVLRGLENKVEQSKVESLRTSMELKKTLKEIAENEAAPTKEAEEKKKWYHFWK
jgi:DNA-binding transcriptional MerR regulator